LEQRWSSRLTPTDALGTTYGSDDAACDLHLATVVVNAQDMRRAVAF
jgi:hypothetical protein